MIFTQINSIFNFLLKANTPETSKRSYVLDKVNTHFIKDNLINITYNILEYDNNEHIVKYEIDIKKNILRKYKDNNIQNTIPQTEIDILLTEFNNMKPNANNKITLNENITFDQLKKIRNILSFYKNPFQQLQIFNNHIQYVPFPSPDITIIEDKTKTIKDTTNTNNVSDTQHMKSSINNNIIETKNNRIFEIKSDEKINIQTYYYKDNGTNDEYLYIHNLTNNTFAKFKLIYQQDEFEDKKDGFIDFRPMLINQKNEIKNRLKIEEILLTTKDQTDKSKNKTDEPKTYHNVSFGNLQYLSKKFKIQDLYILEKLYVVPKIQEGFQTSTGIYNLAQEYSINPNKYPEIKTIINHNRILALQQIFNISYTEACNLYDNKNIYLRKLYIQDELINLLLENPNIKLAINQNVIEKYIEFIYNKLSENAAFNKLDFISIYNLKNIINILKTQINNIDSWQSKDQSTNQSKDQSTNQSKDQSKDKLKDKSKDQLLQKLKTLLQSNELNKEYTLTTDNMDLNLFDTDIIIRKIVDFFKKTEDKSLSNFISKLINNSTNLNHEYLKPILLTLDKLNHIIQTKKQIDILCEAELPIHLKNKLLEDTINISNLNLNKGSNIIMTEFINKLKQYNYNKLSYIINADNTKKLHNIIELLIPKIHKIASVDDINNIINEFHKQLKNDPTFNDHDLITLSTIFSHELKTQLSDKLLRDKAMQDLRNMKPEAQNTINHNKENTSDHILSMGMGALVASLSQSKKTTKVN